MRMTTISSIALFVALLAGRSAAQTFNFDENGKGTEISTAGVVTPIPFSNPPLTYHLGYPSTPGDILLFEPTSLANVLSDILRFDAQGNVTVFSDASPSDPADSLADVTQFPAPGPVAVPLTETGPEIGPNGLFGYTPAFGTPGAPSVATAPPVTFNFTSDVPEPSTLLLFAGAALALLVRRRRPIAGSSRAA